MAEVRPFKGIFYDYQKMDISRLVAPPYDVISPEMQDELYAKSKYNVIRLILGKILETDNEFNNRYTRAKEFWNSWLESGILKEDERECFYIYEQEFEVEGKKYVRKALMGRVRIEDFDKKVIIPHEKTLSSPKEDRFKLLSAVKANLSPVFGIVLDNGDVFSLLSSSSGKFLFEFVDENGVTHRFYRIEDLKSIEALEKAFSDKSILIADGHHRYETALRYKKEMEKQPDYDENAPYNYVLMAIVSSKDEGLVVLPIHRVVKNVDLTDERIVETFRSVADIVKHVDAGDIMRVPSLIESMGRGYFALIYEKGKKALIFKLKTCEDKTDVELMHEKILSGVFGITKEDLEKKTKLEYFKSLSAALDFVRRGGGKFILCYNPPKVEEIARVSLSSRTMPQKSTYFYPKFYSGLVFYRIG